MTERSMKAWRLERMGGDLRLEDVPMPEVRPGSVLVQVEASLLMSYIKPYVEGRLPFYSTPDAPYTPVGNGVGVVEAVGRDVWGLQQGQRVLLSSLFVANERVADPSQLLIGVTAMDAAGKALQADWPNGTLAEYALYPAAAVTPVDNLPDIDSAQLAAVVRCAIPYGGLLRGRLAGGETVIVTGASGSYGSAATLVALAMGAGNVIAAGRNAKALALLADAGGARVKPVTLSGDAQADAASLRTAAAGGAQLAFDMVGQAADPNATLAALGALRRGGRLVLMGSMTVPLPLSYTQVMANDLEIIGQFMYPANASRRLLDFVSGGLLNIGAIAPKVFALADLPQAMDAAANAASLECIVVRP
jgi:alcohol dehydrogenase